MATTLELARKELGNCAKKIANLAPRPLTKQHAELQIGVGTCVDWVAWASGLRTLDFSTLRKRNSSRAASHLEATRFTYTWTATNALFSRDAVLSRFTAAKLPDGESKRFRVLWKTAALTTSEKAALVDPLHKTLASMRTPKEFPWATVASVRIIDLIHYKYTPDAYKTKGDAAKIRDVVVNGQPVTSLDLPTIIYCTRNWLMHSALLDSSFRGSPAEFRDYMIAVTEALATVIHRSATMLHMKL